MFTPVTFAPEVFGDWCARTGLVLPEAFGNSQTTWGQPDGPALVEAGRTIDRAGDWHGPAAHRLPGVTKAGVAALTAVAKVFDAPEVIALSHGVFYNDPSESVSAGAYRGQHTVVVSCILGTVHVVSADRNSLVRKVIEYGPRPEPADITKTSVDARALTSAISGGFAGASTAVFRQDLSGLAQFINGVNVNTWGGGALMAYRPINGGLATGGAIASWFAGAEGGYVQFNAGGGVVEIEPATSDALVRVLDRLVTGCLRTGQVDAGSNYVDGGDGDGQW